MVIENMENINAENRKDLKRYLEEIAQIKEKMNGKKKNQKIEEEKSIVKEIQEEKWKNIYMKEPNKGLDIAGIYYD